MTTIVVFGPQAPALQASTGAALFAGGASSVVEAIRQQLRGGVQVCCSTQPTGWCMHACRSVSFVPLLIDMHTTQALKALGTGLTRINTSHPPQSLS